jgi:hypothetical protein
MKIKEINKLLRWIILLLSIFLLVCVLTYKLDNCDKCSFNYNGTTITPNQFMKVYSQNCLVFSHVDDLQLNLSNPLYQTEGNFE